MKKIIIMSLFATLLSVFTATAQSNTYSIIIKMQNGTVFTIGPNEADSIYFDDGKLTVSGKSIEAIEERVGILETAVSSVMGIANKNSNDIDENKKYILDLMKKSESYEKDVKDVQAIANSNTNKIEQLQKLNYDLASDIAVLKKDNEDMKESIYRLEAIVSELQNK